MEGIKIHLYALCWNEVKILPFFFRHYDPIVDQYFIFDNHSTDGSQQVLNEHARVTWETFEVQGNSFVEHARNMYNQMWKRSRGQADWVIVCNIDELFWHSDLKAYLARCKASNITVISSGGFEMWSDTFPVTDLSLNTQVIYGSPRTSLNKKEIFNPDKIEEINFSVGRHEIEPLGDVRLPEVSEIKLLHYKFLGLEYVLKRYDALRQGLRSHDIEQGWGEQYTQQEAETISRYLDIKATSIKIF